MKLKLTKAGETLLEPERSDRFTPQSFIYPLSKSSVNPELRDRSVRIQVLVSKDGAPPFALIVIFSL